MMMSPSRTHDIKCEEEEEEEEEEEPCSSAMAR